MPGAVLQMVMAAASLCELDGGGAALSEICRPAGLSFEAAVDRALSVSRSLTETEAQITGSGAEVRRARIGLLPQLTGQAAYDRLSDVENPPLGAPLSAAERQALDGQIGSLADPVAAALWSDQLSDTGGLSFPVIQDNFALEAQLSWSLQQNLLAALDRVGAAGAARQGRVHQRTAVERNVRLNAATAYLSVVVAQGREVIARESVRRSESLQQEVLAQTLSGAALESDLLRVQAQTARLQGSLAEATHARARTVQGLRTLLQLPGGDTIELAVDLTLPTAQLLSFETALSEAMAQRAELDQLKAFASAAAEARDAAFWGQLPDLQVSGSLRRARPNPRVIPPVDEFRGDWRVGAALSWSPTGFFLARAEAQSADAEVVQARLAVDQQRDLIRNEVAGGLERARSAAALRATAVVERRAAQEAYRVRRVQYPAGLSTLSDLVDAEAELVTAELRLLNATVQMALSQEELARTLGRVR